MRWLVPKGDHTREAIAARIADREDYVITLRRAHEYAVGHKLRARKVVSMKLFPGVERNALHNALQGTSKLVSESPFDPVAAGLLEPKVAEVKKRVRDKTRIDESEGGDAFLRLAGNARSKQVQKEEAAHAVEQRKQARLEKKEAAEAEAKAQREAFDKCTPACQCGVVPCPQASLQLCATCGDIKKHLCRKVA